jgi:hypothetical protein
MQVYVIRAGKTAINISMSVAVLLVLTGIFPIGSPMGAPLSICIDPSADIVINIDLSIDG